MKILCFYIKELAIKELKTTFRYKFELIGGILFLSAIIISIFYGVKGMSPETFQSSGPNSLLIGFLLMMLINGAFSYPSTISSDAINEGNLEFMMLFPLNFDVYLTTQSLIKVYVSLITFMMAMILTALVIADLSIINAKLIFMLLLLLPASFSGLGAGLILAALTLKYKRIGSVSGMITLLVSFMLSYSPTLTSPFVEVLPMKAYCSLVKNVLIYNKPFDIVTMTYIFASSAIFYLLGLIVFKIVLLSAKKKGNLKNY